LVTRLQAGQPESIAGTVVRTGVLQHLRRRGSDGAEQRLREPGLRRQQQSVRAEHGARQQVDAGLHRFVRRSAQRDDRHELVTRRGAHRLAQRRNVVHPDGSGNGLDGRRRMTVQARRFDADVHHRPHREQRLAVVVEQRGAWRERPDHTEMRRR
jgi:hypothetical protein